MTYEYPELYVTLVRSAVRLRPAIKLRRHGSAFAILLIVSVFLLAAGCSRAQSSDAATEALNSHLKKEHLILMVVLGRVGRCAPIGLVEGSDLTSVTEYRDAQKAGLISIKPDGPGFWQVELINPKPNFAELLKKAPRTQKNGCDYIFASLGIASKQVAGKVDMHAITSDKAEVGFSWKWNLDPSGVKLVDSLSESERAELSPLIWASTTRRPDPTFNLADITGSSVTHPDRTTLKKSGDGWTID